MTTADMHRTIHALWRIEAAKLIAFLARMVGDVGMAEDLAQEAFVKALERWPSDGIPNNPAAWLMATAKRRAIDQIRRRTMSSRKHAALKSEYQNEQADPAWLIETALDDEIGDEILTLMFCACHPILSHEGRVSLTLRLIGGLSTDEIARAFLLPETTIAQRIVRAKRTLREAHIPFEIPRGNDRVVRLQSVLEVIFLIFNEGYAATSGDGWMRTNLCTEALRLGRRLAALAPGESEVHGLIALMELQTSRFEARQEDDGTPIMLSRQDRSRWDPLRIRLGLEAIARAEKTGIAPGYYYLQAAITACHSRAGHYLDTDWSEIEHLYLQLAQLAPTPVVKLNLAVAVSMTSGPAEALKIVDALNCDPALKAYHYLPSVRGDLLFRLGRLAEAQTEFLRAASLSGNSRERTYLRHRADDCGNER